MTGSFTLSNLEYTLTLTRNLNSNVELEITINFDWPGKTSLYIEMFGLVNPLIEETGVFAGYTTYDGRLIDTTDPVDFTNKL